MRLIPILLAMALILLAGVLSARHLERRMGVSAVPGLVLVDCPTLGANALEDMRGLWTGATLEWVPAGQGRLLPFDGAFVSRHAVRGDAMALFSAAALEREAGDVALWPVVLGGYPGRDPAERAEALVDSVVEFMEQRPGSRPFVLGVQFEPGLSEQAVGGFVSRLVEVARGYPGSRRTAVVLLGEQGAEAVAGPVNRRWCLRIPVGDWSRRQEAELRDLLEQDRVAPASARR